MVPFLKEVMSQPKMVLDFIEFIRKNDVCRKKTYQGSRFMIETAKVFPLNVTKLPISLSWEMVQSWHTYIIKC